MASTIRQSIASISTAALLFLCALGSDRAFAGGPIIYLNARAAPNGNGQNWAHAYRNLQDALTLAANTAGAKQIWVAAGTYKPGTSPADSFMVTDQTAIYGGFSGHEATLSQRRIGGNPTILSGDLSGNDIANRNDPRYGPSRADNAFHVVVIADSATVTLDGLTIGGGYSHGALTDDGFSGIGAGIYVDSGGFDGNGNGFGTAYLTLRNLTVSHNDAIGRPGRIGLGGGLWQLYGTLSIEQSVFDDNSAPDEGGGLVAGDDIIFGTVMDSVVITHSSFTNNASTRLANGLGSGALEMATRSVDIEASTFSRNAGGEAMFQLIYLTSGDAPGKALIANNTFTWNTAGAIGVAGALQLLTRAPGQTITLQDNTFTHNTSLAFGGALFVRGRSDFLIERNAFIHNSAGVGGGAVYVDSAISDITVRDSHFIQNAVLGTPIPLEFLNFQARAGALYSPALQQGGGAIAIDDGSGIQIQGSMFNGNTAPLGGAISVIGYGYLDGPPWDYSDGLPDFSAYTETPLRPASATISNSTFLNNRATTGDGGAIFAGAVMTTALSFQGGTFPAITTFGPTTVTVTGSSFQQNVAARSGGAIAGEYTTASVALSSFFKDVAVEAGAHAYFASSTVNAYSSSTQPANVLQSLLSTSSFRMPGATGIASQ